MSTPADFAPSRDAEGPMSEAKMEEAALRGDLDLDLESFMNDPDRTKHAEDAIDYEDIGDDDLAEEEDDSPQQMQESFQTAQTEQTDPLNMSFNVNGEIGEGEGDGEVDDDFAYLFGENPSSPGQVQDHNSGDMDLNEEELFGGADILDDPQSGFPAQSIEHEPPTEPAKVAEDSVVEADATRDEEMVDGDLEGDEMWQSQMRLLREAKGRWTGDAPAVEIAAPPPAQSHQELIEQMFPTFKKGHTLKFSELLPSVKAHYVGKQPLKLPKSVLPTKVGLALQHDDDKDFRLLRASHKRKMGLRRDEHAIRLVPILEDKAKAEQADNMIDEESDFENEDVGGFSWQDFQVVCGDWDVPSREPTPELDTDSGASNENNEDDELFFDLLPAEGNSGLPSAKRRKLGSLQDRPLTSEQLSEKVLQSMPRYEFPTLHDPEKATSRIAKGVVLDLNDPFLLVEEAEQEQPDSSAYPDQTSELQGDRRLQQIAKRYNIANDAEYDLLKENQQSKSRSTIGNLAVNHSMPALRLQWPYYKTMLEKTETRSFHRPAGYFPKMETVTFKQPKVVKKKHIKGKEPVALFGTTGDLSLGDNSHVLLLEYSEQHPLVMSNFGMNSRIINYYRRKDTEDASRPKLEIGETSILQPQDVSPLTIFGHIDPGETTPAVYNGMFKAPIFDQSAKTTDFILVRNATGVDGSNWFLRNIEYVRVVGQQFPSVEVPGPNARKVTTAAKNRLKMVSFRLLRRKKPHRIQVSEITPHILDPNGAPSNDMQNRQKLKEFMRFNKEHKEWEMPDGAPVPEEDAVRTLVSPEDVCLLEAMQVGQQQLKDAGYAQAEDEDDESITQSLEQQLVPWATTKNFIQASNNKAMLQLHGEGDPTKRGEALSMLKISMKGGFKAEGESLNEKMDAQRQKELGGHSYNVAKQQEEYDRTVRKIWEKQKQALSSHVEPDVDPGEEEEEEEDDPVLQSMMDGPDVQTMRQQAPARQPRDDESVSQFSRRSMNSQPQQVLKIVRRIRTRTGAEEEKIEYVRDERVIKQYLTLRREKDAQNIDFNNLTQEQLLDPLIQAAVQRELERLERNKERRMGREKQRAGASGADGGDDEAGAGGASTEANVLSELVAAQATTALSSGKGKGKGNTGGTGRKCANCGQVGHIKTNKKLCPMLNGTMKQEDSFRDQQFSVSITD